MSEPSIAQWKAPAGRISRAHIPAILLACGVLFSSGTELHATELDRTVTFDIDAQPLEKALVAFSQQADIQVVLNTEPMDKAEVQPLKRTVSARTGLIELLRDTGYRYAPIGARTVSVMRIDGGPIRMADADDASAQPGAVPSQENQRAREPADSTSSSDVPGLKIQEVTITARRTEENSQRVPISVTALSQEMLRERNIQTFSDLQYYVPSMTLSVGGTRDDLYTSIRGISGSATDSQAVLTYINEVPLPPGPVGGTGGGGPGSFFDLESVQVLKGPQGTLFGRNAMGGAIVFQTKRPTDRFEGDLQVTTGKYNNREIEGAINVPLISDKLLMRLAGNWQERDGFTEVVASGTSADANADFTDFDNRHVLAGRFTVTFRPGERFQNDLIFDIVDNNNDGTSYVLSVFDPNGLAAETYPEFVDAFARQQAIGIRKHIPTDVRHLSRRRYTSTTDIATINLTDNVVFRNILNYGETRQKVANDTDQSPFLLRGTQFPYQFRQYSEEAQLQGTSLGGKLKWVTGAIYMNRPAMPFEVGISFRPDELLRDDARHAEKSVAGYAQGTYDLSSVREGLKFTAGFRYTKDTKLEQFRSPAGCVECTVTGQGSFHAPSWTLGLDYQVNPRTLVYLASRRGFHAGGFNPESLLLEDRSYSSELVIDQELGVKSDWRLAGMPLRTNFAFYHQDYTDIQIITEVPVANGEVDFVFKNAGKATTWGTEFEAEVFPTDRFSFNVNGDWLDFRYTEALPGVNFAELEREELTGRPRFKYGVGARYRLPIASTLGNLSVNAAWNWQTRTCIQVGCPPEYTCEALELTDCGIEPLAIQGAFGLLTVGADWNDVGGKPMDLAFFMTNATDKVYKENGSFRQNQTGLTTFVYGEPRIWGLRLRYRFGEK